MVHWGQTHIWILTCLAMRKTDQTFEQRGLLLIKSANEHQVYYNAVCGFVWRRVFESTWLKEIKEVPTAHLWNCSHSSTAQHQVADNKHVFQAPLIVFSILQVLPVEPLVCLRPNTLCQLLVKTHEHILRLWRVPTRSTPSCSLMDMYHYRCFVQFLSPWWKQVHVGKEVSSGNHTCLHQIS